MTKYWIAFWLMWFYLGPASLMISEAQTACTSWQQVEAQVKGNGTDVVNVTPEQLKALRAHGVKGDVDEAYILSKNGVFIVVGVAAGCVTGLSNPLTSDGLLTAMTPPGYPV